MATPSFLSGDQARKQTQAQGKIVCRGLGSVTLVASQAICDLCLRGNLATLALQVRCSGLGWGDGDFHGTPQFASAFESFPLSTSFSLKTTPGPCLPTARFSLTAWETHWVLGAKIPSRDGVWS